MIVNLCKDIQWISQCYEFDENHLHLSVYLIETDDGYVLVDTGTFFHQDTIVREINEITDGKGPDELVLTNSTYEHTGNVSHFKNKWNGLSIITPADIPGQIGLPGEEKWRIGQTSSVAGRELTFIRPPFTDVLYSVWILDEESKTLFTAEAFGHFHMPDECASTSEDLREGFDYENVHQFYAHQLPWLEYVDVQKLESAIEEKIRKYEIDRIAPIHGNPIHESELDDYLSLVSKSITEVAKDGNPYAE